VNPAGQVVRQLLTKRWMQAVRDRTVASRVRVEAVRQLELLWWPSNK
jgi:hypothetical protein